MSHSRSYYTVRRLQNLRELLMGLLSGVQAQLSAQLSSPLLCAAF